MSGMNGVTPIHRRGNGGCAECAPVGGGESASGGDEDLDYPANIATGKPIHSKRRVSTLRTMRSAILTDGIRGLVCSISGS